jgi:hypothetical protein
MMHFKYFEIFYFGFKVNVTKFAKIRNVKEKIKFLRDAGRQKLMERIQIMQNSEELPNDILTNILKASGLFKRLVHNFSL